MMDIAKLKLLHYLDSGDMSLTLDEIRESVVERHGYNWMEKKVGITPENIGLVTQSTKYPVPLSYFYSIVMDSSFDAKIDKNPGKRSVNRILELFSPDSIYDQLILCSGKRFTVSMVDRVFTQEFLVYMGLTGEYALDINTASVLRDMGFRFTNSPYKYRFAVNGRKTYSPLCCLPESLHNTYINDLSQVCVDTIGVSECVNMLCVIEGGAFSSVFDNIDGKKDGCFTVETSMIINENAFTKNSFSYREAMLDQINNIINIIK